MTTVFRWILEGQAEHDVREAIALQWEGADAGPLIIAAVGRFLEAGQFEADVMRGWCAEAYREIYRRAMESGDAATALRAVKHLAQLGGHG